MSLTVNGRPLFKDSVDKFMYYRHTPDEEPTPRGAYTYGMVFGFSAGMVCMGLAVCPLMPWWDGDDDT